MVKRFIYICSSFETIFDEYRPFIYMKLLLDYYTELWEHKQKYN